MNSKLNSILGIVAWSMLLLPGCGAKQPATPVNNATVHGSLQLDGKPIGPVSLEFYSDHFGKVGQAQVNKEGEIQTADPIPVGGYLIVLGPPETGTIPHSIPHNYFIDTSSGLHYELQAGDNELTIQLKK